MHGDSRCELHVRVPGGVSADARTPRPRDIRPLPGAAAQMRGNLSTDGCTDGRTDSRAYVCTNSITDVSADFSADISADFSTD